MEIRRLLGELGVAEKKEESEGKFLAAQVVFDSVRSAYVNHKFLGDEGKELVRREGDDGVNDHLRADVESEERMVEMIDRWGRENEVKVVIRGEEVGNKIVGDIESDEESLVVLDGLDGTANYKKKKDWSYGAMIAMALSGDPTYNDFEVAAIGLFEEGVCLIGIKDVGVFVVSFESKAVTKLEVFDELEEFDYGLVLADDYFEAAKRLIGKQAENWKRTGSTAATLAAIAIGDVVENSQFPIMNKGWQSLVDVGRKGMLEWPVVYLIVKGLGGYVVDKNGEDIGKRKFSKFSQKKNWLDEQERDVYEPIMVAKNQRILEEVRRLLEFNFG